MSTLRFAIPLITACLLTAGSALAASDPTGDIPRSVADFKTAGGTFAATTLFVDAVDAATVGHDARFAAAAEVDSVVADATVAHLDLTALDGLRKSPPSALALAVPYVDALGAAVELELVQVNLFADGFRVATSDDPDGKAVGKVDLGVHYRGMVRGEPRSLVALSLLDGEVMGFVSSPTLGNLVVGRLDVEASLSRQAPHVIYAEEDLRVQSSFACAVDGEHQAAGGVGKARRAAQAVAASQLADPQKALSDCVKIYIEADYDIYQTRGGTSGATSFLTGLFNQVATLFANESIKTEISQIFVWTSSSPYSGSVSSSMLNQFGNIRTSFNGDLAHLVNFKGGGGIAWVDTLCSSARYRQAVSGLQNGYSSVPTYSWSVEVFTHEMGHNLGSPHTQRCAWNGNNTAIDGCVAVEPANACPRPGLPSGGGTIMSYCHLSSVGINFNNGFGPQPGNLIRNRVSGASCLSACSGGGGGTCSGDTYSGTLTGNGDTETEPNGTYYYSGSSGTHRGVLSGPGGADFDLELYRWTGSWTKVAEGTSPTSSEDVSYSGPSGYYIWQVVSYSGSGSYSLCLTRP
ncbi:MAG: M12 family metallo-peptidase [Acidobacteriota bacterium]